MTKSENNNVLRWAKKIKTIDSMGGKCQKCGNDDIRVLTFHHVNTNEKEYKMSILMRMNWDLLEKEALKCIILCDNCHRELHYNENSEISRSKINKRVLLEYKGSHKCERCGYDKCIASLDFHHPNNDKIFNIGDIGKHLTLDNLTYDIINEVNKCIVLCRNCHTLEHLKEKDFYNEYHDKIIEKTKSYKKIRSKIDEDLIYEMYINNKMRVIDISRKYNLPKGTISSILRRLEDKGILKRRIITGKNKIVRYCILCNEKLDYRNKTGCCKKCKKEYNKKMDKNI